MLPSKQAVKMLYGTIIVTKVDKFGEEFEDLTEEDFEILARNTKRADDGRWILTNVSYANGGPVYEVTVWDAIS